MKIEIVKWLDAGGDTQDWRHPDDVEDDNPIITSVGYVVKETANNLTLAMDLSDDGETHGRSRVPVRMIIDRTVIWGEEEGDK